MRDDVLNVWSGGQLLAFSGLDGPTDFCNGLTLRTAFDGIGLDVKLPGPCRIRFAEGAPEQVLLTGDMFRMTLAGERIQGAFLDACHVLIEGPCRISSCSPAITAVQQGRQSLIGNTEKFAPDLLNADLSQHIASRLQWLESRQTPQDLSTTTRQALYKALSQMKTQVYAPEGAIQHRWTTPDRWPHRGMWLWDSVFHAIGWRHIDIELARDIISAVLDMQRDDGFIPHEMRPDRCSNITQPPVLALGVKLVNAIAPDIHWLNTVYPKLAAYVEWDLAHRDTDGGGLAEWFIEGDAHCRSGESGMDNSPRFDSATQLDAVDFNAFLASECEILAEFAAALDKPEEAEHWRQRYSMVCALINQRLWNEEIGFYVDYDVEANAPSTVLASAGFLPLLCGAASPEQAQRLVDHLRDPQMFGSAFPIPSIAVKDTEHYRKDMWRGPTWINLNWLIAFGFARYGMTDVAQEIRQRTLGEIERWYRKYGTFFEFYDDRGELDPPQLLRKGRCAPQESPYHQVFFDYGWSATLYVDMLLTTRCQATRLCCK